MIVPVRPFPWLQWNTAILSGSPAK